MTYYDPVSPVPEKEKKGMQRLRSLYSSYYKPILRWLPFWVITIVVASFTAFTGRGFAAALVVTTLFVVFMPPAMVVMEGANKEIRRNQAKQIKTKDC